MRNQKLKMILAPAILAVGIMSPAILTAQEVQFAPDFGDVLDPVGLFDIGSSLGDYDNDGDLDILFQGSSSTNARRLFRNRLVEDGQLSFENVTPDTGPVSNNNTGWSAAWADLNGDHFPEFFLGQSNNRDGNSGDLYLNADDNGTRVFQDISSTTIDDPGFHQNVAWADMNNDSLLDLVIGMEGPQQHEIYLQNPDFSFDQVGEQVGLHIPFGTKAYGCAIADPDKDGDLDIYISTCRSGGNIRNNFFRNNLIPDGTLSFTDIADDNGTQFFDNSYHAEFQDLNNDGWLDLFMVGADGQDSKIWRNNTDGSWTDIDTLNGSPLLSNNGGDNNGGKAIDYDNDGDLDLFFHDHKAGSGQFRARSLYRNDGDWTFTEVTFETGLLEDLRGGYDSAWGDIDQDGDVDLIATAEFFGVSSQIYFSDASTNGNGSLFFRLRYEDWNTRAIGATMTGTLNPGTDDEATLTRMMNAQAGTFNQSDVPVHFGLGASETLYNVQIAWPNGPTTSHGDFEVDPENRGEVIFIDFPGEELKDLWKVE